MFKDSESQMCEKIGWDFPSLIMLVPSLVTLWPGICVISVRRFFFFYVFLAFFQIPKMLATPGVG